MTRRINIIALAVFLALAGLLLLLHGQRMVLTNDEGIVLESAQRMASGGRIYVDFFGYMSPGSYWLQALVFRFLGVALWTARLIVILDFSVQCALVFWLAARLSSWRAATAVTLTFAGFQVADPAFLTSAHRWDSATLALAGLCLAVSALSAASPRSAQWRWLGSGAALAAAAWCTPSMAIVAVLVAVWLAVSKERRNRLIPLAGGAALIGAAGVLALAASGSITAFIGQMAWLQKNYAASNVFPYGSVIGGYRSLFEGATGIAEFSVRALLVGCLALPAALPPAALLLWGIALWRREPRDSPRRPVLQMLLLGMTGLVITVFPRADVTHLAFVAALPYVLAGTALAHWLPARTGSLVALGSMMLAGVFASNYARGWSASDPVASPAGVLRVARDQAPEVRKLMEEVHAGDSLFVYPYMPVQYFLTQGRNPTRFPYLQPGLMTRQQEAEALAQLQARPPEWLLYLQLSQDEFLRVFPNGAGLNWRFTEIEAWMEHNYRPADGPPVTVGGYRLWRRGSVAEAAALKR